MRFSESESAFIQAWTRRPFACAASSSRANGSAPSLRARALRDGVASAIDDGEPGATTTVDLHEEIGGAERARVGDQSRDARGHRPARARSPRREPRARGGAAAGAGGSARARGDCRQRKRQAQSEGPGVGARDCKARGT